MSPHQNVQEMQRVPCMESVLPTLSIESELTESCSVDVIDTAPSKDLMKRFQISVQQLLRWASGHSPGGWAVKVPVPEPLLFLSPVLPLTFAVCCESIISKQS